MLRIIIFLIAFFLAVPSYASNQTSSGKTTTNIITLARDRINEDTAGFNSDAALLRSLNEGLREIIFISGCSEISERHILNSGTSEYIISANYMKVNTVIYQTGATIFRTLKQGEILGVGYQGGADEPEYYYENQGKVGVYPLKDSSNVTVSGNTIYVYLTPLQGDLMSGQAIPTPACYDQALVDYIVSEAIARDAISGSPALFELSNLYFQRFLMRIQNCMTRKPKEETWQILRPREDAQ